MSRSISDFEALHCRSRWRIPRASALGRARRRAPRSGRLGAAARGAVRIESVGAPRGDRLGGRSALARGKTNGAFPVCTYNVDNLEGFEGKLTLSIFVLFPSIAIERAAIGHPTSRAAGWGAPLLVTRGAFPPLGGTRRRAAARPLGGCQLGFRP